MDSIFAAEVVWYERESDCMRQPEKERSMQVDARHAPRAQPPHWEGATRHHFTSMLLASFTSLPGEFRPLPIKV
jgi:hypothetical protein